MGGEGVSELPKLIPFSAAAGLDSAERWQDFVDGLYGIYFKFIVKGNLMFRNLPVRCRACPETFGKHFAFWHMMQEGKIENDRTIDPGRCERLLWIPWIIQNAEKDVRIRVFKQSPRDSNTSWALWLFSEKYAVILHERTEYFLLKTAFLVKPHKQQEFERDWKKHTENG
jgi:hypothetical protein